MFSLNHKNNNSKREPKLANAPRAWQWIYELKFATRYVYLSESPLYGNAYRFGDNLKSMPIAGAIG